MCKEALQADIITGSLEVADVSAGRYILDISIRYTISEYYPSMPVYSVL